MTVITGQLVPHDRTSIVGCSVSKTCWSAVNFCAVAFTWSHLEVPSVMLPSFSVSRHVRCCSGSLKSSVEVEMTLPLMRRWRNRGMLLATTCRAASKACQHHAKNSGLVMSAQLQRTRQVHKHVRVDDTVTCWAMIGSSTCLDQAGIEGHLSVQMLHPLPEGSQLRCSKHLRVVLPQQDHTSWAQAGVCQAGNPCIYAAVCCYSCRCRWLAG
jgi:hypothetical protein